MTLRDFRQTGRLGCATCYATFEQSLRELLRRVHGNAKHRGRHYEPPPPNLLEGLSTLGELRERLRLAITNEQFELAAQIRDQIKVLE
jgi:protein arginine kinase activator